MHALLQNLTYRGLLSIINIVNNSFLLHLYSNDPIKPHCYVVKLGFTGVSTISLILLENIGCWYSLEPPCRGGSNECPQSMF